MDEVASQPAPVGDGPSATTGRRAVLDVAVQVLGRVLNLVLGVVVTLVIARRLGDRGFGQWSTIFAVFQITAYFGSLGLERVAVGRAAAEPEQQSAWLGALVSLRLVIAIPVALVTAAVIGLVSETDAMLLAGLILCVNLLLNGLGATRAIFQLQVRNAVNVAVELANGILWGVAAILVAADRGGLVELAAAFVAVNVLTTGLQVGAALRAAPLHLRGSRGRWGELARIGIPVGIGGVLVLAYGRIDQILVFEIAGDRAAGLYGAVYRVLDRVQLVPESLMVTLFPLMAAAHGLDRQRVRHLFQLALDYMLVLSLPLLAFTVVAGRPLVVALFGSPFADAAPAMPVLMGAFVLICVGYLLGNVIIIVGLQGRLVRFAALALVVNVALNLLLIPSQGFLAAAWVTLLTEALVMGLAGRAVLSALGLRPRLGRIARAVVAATAMGALVGALRGAGAPIGLLMAAAAVSYPLLALIAGAVSLSELRSLMARQAP